MTKSSKIFAESFWIWPESNNWDLQNCYALFRKEFALRQVPKKAPLFITADQSYQLYVNGHYVCRGPARGFQKSWPFDEVDIQRFLRAGMNLFAVRTHNPGTSNFQYIFQGFAGFLVAARWGRTILHSDQTWKCRRQTGVNRCTVLSSLQLFPQEHLDLRQEAPDWMMPGFDDRDWTGPVAVYPWNGMPWSDLEPRGIPMLEEQLFEPGTCIGIGEGSCAPGYRHVRDVARLRHRENLSHKAYSSNSMQLKVEPTKKRHFRTFLIDFGKTIVGSAGFEIEGAQGGEILDTLHVETIDPVTLTPDFEPDKSSRMAFSHRLVCRPGNQTHQFYHSFGFRYMVVTVRDISRYLRILPFVRSALYPLKEEGNFETSDSVLQSIWRTCAWTQRVCCLDAYVDTPWREQAQWWGDARVQAWNTFHLANDARLFRRGIAQIAAQTTPNGLTYGHAPTMAHHCILPDFSLIWLLTIWDYYWQTGSTEPLEKHEATIDGILRYFRSFIHPKTGLVQHDSRYWLFLDWTEIQREGCPSILSLWLLIALDKLAQLYAVRKNRARHIEMRRWGTQLRASLERLVTLDGLICDGYDGKGKLVSATSPHSQALGLSTALHPASNGKMLGYLLSGISEDGGFGKAQPSAYWITYIFSVLQRHGYGATVVEHISRHWESMVSHGTTWENFHPRRGDESFSHAWSAHPLYHLTQTIGGITQSAPAWKTITFNPVFHGDNCRASVPTPNGPIYMEWEKTSRRINVSLLLPKGTTAKVRLPGFRNRTYAGENRWKVMEE